MTQLLTLKEAAARLCVSPHTLRGWTYAGRVPCVRLSNRLRFDARDIDRLVDRCRVGARREVAL